MSVIHATNILKVLWANISHLSVNLNAGYCHSCHCLDWHSPQNYCCYSDCMTVLCYCCGMQNNHLYICNISKRWVTQNSKYSIHTTQFTNTSLEKYLFEQPVSSSSLSELIVITLTAGLGVSGITIVCRWSLPFDLCCRAETGHSWWDEDDDADVVAALAFESECGGVFSFTRFLTGDKWLVDSFWYLQSWILFDVYFVLHFLIDSGIHWSSNTKNTCTMKSCIEMVKHLLLLAIVTFAALQWQGMVPLPSED